MTIACMILGIACILYFFILVLYTGHLFDFGWFWLVLAGAFFLIALSGKYPDNMLWVWIRRILPVFVAIGIVILLAFSIYVIKGMNSASPDDIDYAIVLGAQVRKTRPSKALRRRLDQALETAERCPDAIFILSGGQGSGELISEAECMKQYLTEHGMKEERLVLEDKSTSTRENLVFSDRLTGCRDKKCGIISNDFHISRALLIARKAGYTDACGIAAEGDRLMELHYVVREAVALFVGKLRGSF